MKLYRFDASAGHHVEQHGSDFVLSPLTDPEGRVHAACFHLGAGGLIGAHEAATRQLLCVVWGSGWVSGPDGVRVPIERAQAAFFEKGELHETGTDTGLAAVVLEGDDFEPWAKPVDR